MKNQKEQAVQKLERLLIQLLQNLRMVQSVQIQRLKRVQHLAMITKFPRKMDGNGQLTKRRDIQQKQHLYAAVVKILMK